MLLARHILALNFITASMWSESMFAPLRAITSRQKSVFRRSSSDRSGRRCVYLRIAKFGGGFIYAWSTYFWSPFACLQHSRPVWGHFHLYSHAYCACLLLADVRFPGQLLRSCLTSPASRHDLGKLHLPAPAVHKIDPWPPLLSHLLVHVCWWESSWKICLLFWLRKDARWLL
jgi:hypothetical protein